MGRVRAPDTRIVGPFVSARSGRDISYWIAGSCSFQYFPEGGPPREGGPVLGGAAPGVPVVLIGRPAEVFRTCRVKSVNFFGIAGSFVYASIFGYMWVYVYMFGSFVRLLGVVMAAVFAQNKIACLKCWMNLYQYVFEALFN